MILWLFNSKSDQHIYNGLFLFDLHIVAKTRLVTVLARCSIQSFFFSLDLDFDLRIKFANTTFATTSIKFLKRKSPSFLDATELLKTKVAIFSGCNRITKKKAVLSFYQKKFKMLVSSGL